MQWLLVCVYVCAAYVADHHGLRPRPRMTGIDTASSVLSSDIESVSVVGSEDTRSRSTPNLSCFTTLPIFLTEEAWLSDLVHIWHLLMLNLNCILHLVCTCPRSYMHCHHLQAGQLTTDDRHGMGAISRKRYTCTDFDIEETVFPDYPT